MEPDEQHHDVDEYLRERATFITDPISIRRALLLMLRLHYASPYRAEPYKPVLKDYRYHPDVTQRTLEVQLADLYRPEDPRTIPAVYLDGGDMTLAPVGTMDKTVGHSDANDARYYSSNATLPVIIRHLAHSTDEAYAFAMQSVLFLHGVRSRLMEALCLADYRVEQAAGKPTPIKKNPELGFECITALQITWQPQWRSVMEGQRIKKFDLQFLTDT